MCFSAAASFSASAIVGCIAVVTIKKVKEPKEYFFAFIPLLFACQQTVEGIVWLSLTGCINNWWQTPATVSYLFFAQILWPVWVPLSIYFLEKDERRIKILYYALLTGIISGCIQVYRLMANPFHAEISERHIQYVIKTSEFIYISSSIFYIVATITPPFLSTNKGMKLLAICLAGALLFTRIFYEIYLLSVWCFFAAFLSVIVIYVLRMRRML